MIKVSVLSTQIVKVTPEIAQELLDGTEAGANYRRVSGSTIYDYAREMRAGRWTLTHQGIAISDDGNVIDGQHRLRAVINAGIPVEMMVTTGLPSSASVAMDVGVKRTAAQALTHAGYGNATVLAGAARLIITLRENPMARVTRHVSPAEIEEFVVEQESRGQGRCLPELAVTAGRIYRDTRLSPVAMTTGLFFVGDGIDEEDADLFESFVEGVATGVGLAKGDPRLALRAGGARWQVLGHQGVLVATCTVKAWNAYALDRPVTIMRTRLGVEGFPSVQRPR